MNFTFSVSLFNSDTVIRDVTAYEKAICAWYLKEAPSHGLDDISFTFKGHRKGESVFTGTYRLHPAIDKDMRMAPHILQSTLSYFVECADEDGNSPLVFGGQKYLLSSLLITVNGKKI